MKNAIRQSSSISQEFSSGSFKNILKHNLFFVLSILILSTDLIFLALNYSSSKRALEREWNEAWESANSIMELTIGEEARTMLMLARGHAADPEIQQLFLAGKYALETEGGGKGSDKTGRLREKLYQRVAPSWNQMTSEFRVRQLHFHFGPGSLSYLRVHKPQRFGDRMDDLRHIIVDTIAEGTPRMGFETGRIYSGIRGVSPVYATDENNQKILVGALEAGTSFELIMDMLDKALGGGVAVLLHEQHVADTMWKEFVQTHFIDDTRKCDCYIEARSRENILDLINAGHIKSSPRPQPTKIVEMEERYFSILQFPLRDYLGSRHADRGSVGQIVVWRDVTSVMDNFWKNQTNALIFALSAFLVIEFLLFISLRYIIQARDAANAANKAKSDFLATISHEFRTPLNAIIGFAEMLTSGLQGKLNDNQTEYVGFIQDSGQGLLDRIDRILKFQKLEAEYISGPQEVFALNDLIDSVIKDLSGRAEEKNLSIRFTPEWSTNLKAHKAAVKQAVREILVNAIEVAPSGSSIDLKIHCKSRKIQIQIFDQGPGFPDALIANPVQAFSKARGAYCRDDGFGLGLAMTAMLLASQGGSLEFENLKDGGACVRLSIPQMP